MFLSSMQPNAAHPSFVPLVKQKPLFGASLPIVHAFIFPGYQKPVEFIKTNPFQTYVEHKRKKKPALLLLTEFMNGNSNRLLISGKTGSGKSVVLDLYQAVLSDNKLRENLGIGGKQEIIVLNTSPLMGWEDVETQRAENPNALIVVIANEFKLALKLCDDGLSTIPFEVLNSKNIKLIADNDANQELDTYPFVQEKMKELFSAKNRASVIPPNRRQELQGIQKILSYANFQGFDDPALKEDKDRYTRTQKFASDNRRLLEMISNEINAYRRNNSFSGMDDREKENIPVHIFHNAFEAWQRWHVQ